MFANVHKHWYNSDRDFFSFFKLTYNTVLIPIAQHSESIFYTFQNDHLDKSSFDISPYKDIT